MIAEGVCRALRIPINYAKTLQYITTVHALVGVCVREVTKNGLVVEVGAARMHYDSPHHYRAGG